MDTKFSVAVHSLILISEAPQPVTSEEIAASVGTNPTYIRKVLSLLKSAGLIESHRGIRGFRLNQRTQDLCLFQIYCAVSDHQLQFFDIHQNPNDQCIVGKHIKQVLSSLSCKLEQEFVHTLQNQTLKDCIAEIKNREELTESQKRSNKV